MNLTHVGKVLDKIRAAMDASSEHEVACYILNVTLATSLLATPPQIASAMAAIKDRLPDLAESVDFGKQLRNALGELL